ncbi:MAG: zinc-binding dehydrogenase [Bacteroidetes bacterium]|nr:zinc-binding dehydrogenase [Bacteroidota bacterium]
MFQTEAIFLHKKGKPENAFELRKTTLRSLENDEVLIESEAFGLNYADVMARNGLYREAPPFPCVIGYEVVGKIINVGSNVDSNLIGKRVLAFCRFGGYAKHVITRQIAVAEIGDIPFEMALALCTQAVTAYYMSDVLAPIQKGDNVLIHAAAGGVGSILIQLCKRKGSTVIAKVGSDKKIDAVLGLGADYALNYNKSEYVEEIKRILKGDRLDASFNPVAGSTMKKDLALLGSGGRLFLFGGSEMVGGKFGILSTLNFLRKMGVFIPVKLMMLSKNILGVNMLKIADNRPYVIQNCLKEVVELYHKGELKVISGGCFNYTEIAKAHQLLEEGQSMGKISVKW